MPFYAIDETHNCALAVFSFSPHAGHQHVRGLLRLAFGLRRGHCCPGVRGAGGQRGLHRPAVRKEAQVNVPLAAKGQFLT